MEIGGTRAQRCAKTLVPDDRMLGRLLRRAPEFSESYEQV